MAHLLASSPFFRGQVFIMQPALQQIKTRGTMLRGASSAATRCVPRDKQGLLVLRFSRIWGCRTHASKLLQNTPNASKKFLVPDMLAPAATFEHPQERNFNSAHATICTLFRLRTLPRHRKEKRAAKPGDNFGACLARGATKGLARALCVFWPTFKYYLLLRLHVCLII